MSKTPYIIGLDIGSTTVKGIVFDTRTGQTVWRDYERHETRQGEKVLEFLRRIEENVPGCIAGRAAVYVTGSGGKTIAPFLGAKFVQEVNAVCLAVEKLHPEAGSVIELGGQDAKIIIFKEDPETGRKNVIPSMNDKCAGGTGAVLDKINAKLRIPTEELRNQGYDGVRIHHVAGKCGVFAETDINSLQKQGVPTDELMASLFEAIVGQNLSVLTRGHTLRPEVLLLGGPNTFIRGMREAWRANIPRLWEERNFPLPEGVDPASLIKTPDNSQYFGALGAVEFGLEDDLEGSIYKGREELEYFVREGRKKTRIGAPRGLVNAQEELDAFKERFARDPFEPRQFEPDSIVDAFLGIDGGSTSTKAVLLDQDRNVLVKAYQLSLGNPIEDAKDVIRLLEEQVVSSGARLNILGVGTTGYAKDVLKDVLGADAAIVETVAHTESALHYYGNVDVICDVGGQD
ncbi:MAG: CoA activase, partial [Chlorobi bacterium]|nr:CoA activase [Chlorobiota bacterium]